jgi:hypothetical protein
VTPARRASAQAREKRIVVPDPHSGFNVSTESGIVYTTTTAVFTSNLLDGEYPEDDSGPPGGYDFFQALGNAFKEAGWIEANYEFSADNHEHGYWFLHLTYEGQSYCVRMIAIPTSDQHWCAVSFDRSFGCLWLLVPRVTEAMPRSLQRKVEGMVAGLAKTNDLRWVTHEDAFEHL